MSAVSACVELRANYISQLPFDSYREGAGGTSVKVTPQPRVIVKPSARNVPRSAWMKQAQYARMLWGNATLYIGARDGAGYPTSLDVLPPWEVAFDRTSVLERLEVRVAGQPMPAEDVVIVPGQVRPGCTVGVAPLAASGLVELGRRAQDFGRDWFRNGAVPSSILYSDQAMTSDDADAMVGRILEKWRNRKPAVLGSGLRHEKVSVAANESQFIETIRQNQAEIAIVLGIAPEAIGVSVSGSSVTYANREQNAQQVMLNTVNNDILLWQEVLYDIVPRPQFVRFSTGAFLRSDLKTRYESYSLGISSGFIVPNEARAWEDLGPMEGSASDQATESLTRQLQQIYLAVGTVITAEEAREILNRNGAGLKGPGPGPVADVSARSMPDLHVTIDARQEPPVVNVDNRTAPAVVNVDARQEPSVVNVTTPEVTVNVPEVKPVEARSVRKTIEHTPDGRIAAIVEEII